MNEILDDLFKNTAKNASPDRDADEIILIADRSGSMSRIKEDAQGGINAFIKEQQKQGNANLTFIEFDSEITPVCMQTDINEAVEYELCPRGSTSLYDAIGSTLANADSITTTGKKIVVIVTDGGENNSSEWTQSMIFDRIESLKENEWDFLFLAANQDAMSVGRGLGVSSGETVNFAASAVGASAAYDVASTYTTNLRSRSFSKEAVIDMLEDDIDKTEGLSK